MLSLELLKPLLHLHLHSDSDKVKRQAFPTCSDLLQRALLPKPLRILYRRYKKLFTPPLSSEPGGEDREQSRNRGGEVEGDAARHHSTSDRRQQTESSRRSWLSCRPGLSWSEPEGEAIADP